MKQQPKSPFTLALAARRGDIEPAALTPAARRLYNDRTLSREQLSEYANPSEAAPKSNTFSRVRPTFMRG
jgi:hypothetical protein